MLTENELGEAWCGSSRGCGGSLESKGGSLKSLYMRHFHRAQWLKLFSLHFGLGHRPLIFPLEIDTPCGGIWRYYFLGGQSCVCTGESKVVGRARQTRDSEWPLLSHESLRFPYL